MHSRTSQSAPSTSTTQRRRSARASGKRPGMAIIFVLAMLSITLALSYAMMRTQAMSTAIQTNANLRASARQAALAGLGVAQRKMSDGTWGGADSTFSGSLSASESFVVTYATGDASLTSASADYAEYPFRVSITAVGSVSDLADSNKRSTYTATAVMQLIRRRWVSEPSNWTTLNQYSVYQWDGGNTYIQPPVSVQGPVLLQGYLNISTTNPSSNSARSRFLSDLDAMRVAGLGDFRPLTGTVSTPSTRNSSVVSSTLQGLLNLTTVNITASSTQPLTLPSVPSTYQLYAGGKAYPVPSLYATYGSQISNRTIQPDTLTNPLGVYRAGGDVDLRDNVTIKGTILATNSNEDIFIEGRNVQLLGVDLPALSGTTTRTQLPLALVKDDFRLFTDFGAVIRGLCVVNDEFEIQEGNANVTLDFQGRLITRDLWLWGRSSWNQGASNWLQDLTSFLVQLLNNLLSNRILYFPQWLKANDGLDYQPLLTIKPDSSGVSYHWHDWTQPIYLPHASDGGLRWDLIRQSERP